MKELLLVHLPDTPLDGSKSVFTPPLGLWSMRENCADYNISVVDFNIDEPRFQEHDLVGYSLQFPAHTLRLKEFRPYIRARLEYTGGPAQHAEPGMILIKGPGEDWLAEAHVPFFMLKPPHFHSNEMIPYWKLGAPFSGLASHARWMPVETSRGCPNACGFCKIPSLWGKWEGRSVNVLDEYFTYLVKTHGIQEIIIIDDNVVASVERFLKIVELFKKHKLAWSVANGLYNRALLRQDVREAIADSKCLYLSLPFEAGNAHSAALMNLGKKYLTQVEAGFLARELTAMNIHTAGQFIIGYPGETEEDVRETLAYANSLLLNQRHIHIATPLPGTPMHETCLKNGWLVEDMNLGTYKTPLIETPMLSRSTLMTLWKEDREAALRRKE